MLKLIKKSLPMIIAVCGLAVLSTQKVTAASIIEVPRICAKEFSQQQLDVMQQSYNYGKPSDLGYTLAAIAWKESSAGNKPVNWNDPSFGVHHILLKTAAAHEGFDHEKEPLRALALASRLVYDHDESARHSVMVLTHWKGRRKDYAIMLASYYAGNNYKAGLGYASDVINKVKFLQKHGCVL